MERNFVSTVLDQAGALVILLNAEQRIIRYNQTCEKILGYSFGEVKGKFIWDLFTTSEEVEATQALFNKLAKGHFPLEYESQWLTKEGEVCQIAWSSTVLLDHHGLVDYIVNTGHDITERKQIEEALRQGGERYALAVLATNEGLWDWDLQTNEIYFSPRWKAILGFQEDEMQPSVEEWFSRVHPEDLAHLKIDIADHLEGATATFKSEYRMLHWDGNYRWVRTQGLAVRDVHGEPYRMTGSQADITRRKLDEEQLRRASFQDVLTGLPNRAAFMDSLKRAIEQAQKRDDYLFAILFLDLDRFKQVNDNLGHLVGDQLLVTVARRLKECLRSEDTIARLGGDEFTILLENIRGADDAVLVASRIQEKLALPISLAGRELSISASIGISLGGADYNSPEDILNNADGAMYQAKAQGRARYAVYRVGQPYIIEVRSLEMELRQAIEQQEFQLYYQPIVSTLTDQIVGVEALLRWQHPQRGLIMPDKFVPVAEETGLISSIGEWMIRAACSQMKQWHNAGYSPLRLCVNVSVRQFRSDGGPQFSQMVANILKETGLIAQALEVEITESMPLVDNEFNQSILNALQLLGLQIALDDFGVNTPLGLLKQFSVHTLKIDRSFVKGLPHNAHDAAIIEAIIKLAHSLDLKVVAEGVETEEQLAWLRSHQCDEVQGYLFSPPVPASQIIGLIHKSASNLSNFSDIA
jgi:diguanylate cyclase (GGDEF)-like protein/PAS domain S-box-containing protein